MSKDKLSQKEKILRLMVSEKDKMWWYPYEFLNRNGIFIGYKAPTRVSELTIDYPEMIESKMEGKYKLTRFRFENTQEFLPKLPEDLRKFIKQELARSGIPYSEYKTIHEYVEETRSMREVRVLVENK